MSSVYPSSIDSFTNPSGTQTLSAVDHALQHSDANDALEAIETVIGTSSGTAVAKFLSVGKFAAPTAGGTLSTTTISSGTISGVLAGTNTYTGGTASAMLLGTNTLVGGTASAMLIGTSQITNGTISSANIGTPTITLGSDAQGDIFYRSAGGTITRLAPGTSGHFLKTQGGTANPVWANNTSLAIQVVPTTYSTAGTTTSATLVDTGLAGTITPASASNKVLVQFNVCISCNAVDTGANVTLVRGTTSIYSPVSNAGFPTANLRDVVSGVYVDSPGGTTATTYKVQYFRNTGAGSAISQVDSSTSSMVLTEISA